MAQDNAEILERLKKLEDNYEALLKVVEVLDIEAEAKRPRKPLDFKHPLHPSRIGLPEYNKKVAELFAVKSESKDYASAQKQLREAGIV